MIEKMHKHYIWFHFEWGQFYRQSTNTWAAIRRQDLWCLNTEDRDGSYSPIAVPEGVAS